MLDKPSGLSSQTSEKRTSSRKDNQHRSARKHADNHHDERHAPDVQGARYQTIALDYTI
jgi:hypothetical protein